MAKLSLKYEAPYDKECIILTTKHAKSIAIAPAFFKELGATVIEYVADTDLFGTFSGEIERSNNALETARKKCELAFRCLGPDINFALASEGSFSPHPTIPFIQCNQEIIYFIDRKLDFHFHMSCISSNTNYRKEFVKSLKELLKFAKDVEFPSHGLILRAKGTNNDSLIFKEIESISELKKIFQECMENGFNQNVLLQTDMRAQLNPTRMNVIKNLAEKMAERLALNCPNCNTPGWGKIRNEPGLTCAQCNSKTKVTLHEIFGCVKCAYTEKKSPSHGLTHTNPVNCDFCNP